VDDVSGDVQLPAGVAAARQAAAAAERNARDPDSSRRGGGTLWRRLATAGDGDRDSARRARLPGDASSGNRRRARGCARRAVAAGAGDRAGRAGVLQHRRRHSRGSLHGSVPGHADGGRIAGCVRLCDHGGRRHGGDEPDAVGDGPGVHRPVGNERAADGGELVAAVRAGGRRTTARHHQVPDDPQRSRTALGRAADGAVVRAACG
jgi:hypothetical protein